MENEQILNMLNKHFAMLETYGYADKKDLIAIIYIMFMSEYYEFFRDISFRDMDNDKVGLTDCMVKKLNAMLECLKRSSQLVRCADLGEFFTKFHWIIPDDHTDPDPPEPPTPSNPEYIEDMVWYSNGVVNGHVLETEDSINNHILEL